jgi:hypothetical protein
MVLLAMIQADLSGTLLDSVDVTMYENLCRQLSR